MRARYIPENSAAVRAKDIDAVAYCYQQERDGKLWYLAIAYGGKRSKPDWHFRFPTAERRQQKISEWLEGLKAHAASVKERRKRQHGGHELKVGDVLYASWGYDQTNVDFYKVIELKGKTMVRVVPISQAVEASHTTSESVAAGANIREWDVLLGVDRDDADKSRWKRATGDSISLSHTIARKWDGRAKHQTAFGFGH